MMNHIKDELCLIRDLIKTAKETFKTFKVSQKNDTGPKPTYKLTDYLLSGLAMFIIKSPSLLQFDRATRMEDGVAGKNLKNLFGIVKVPSDTQFREKLDPVEPNDFRKTYKAIHEIIDQKGILNEYKVFGKYTIALIDASGVFSSEKVYCKHCCVKVVNSKKTYYHQIVASVMVKPGKREVFPLEIEPVYKEEGMSENDCERNASKRLLKKMKEDYPDKNFIIVADALYGNTPFLSNLNKFNMRYILGVKPGSNKNIFDWIDGAQLTEKKVCKDGIKYHYKFVNRIPLTNDSDAPTVNFFECYIEDGKKKPRHFSWITDFEINLDNVEFLVEIGRSRWKIENETFNTLKNQGYEFEHNFGHGDQNLCHILANLMFIAFLIDQLQQHSCKFFQVALAKLEYRKYLWERMRGFFFHYYIESWEDLFSAIANKYIVSTLQVNTT